jgi:catechol 2,3-dioxygenase-like lactoylglutathione lyase family enzyme
VVHFHKTIPVLRIFDVGKAKEFYVDYLGFSVDWEHHFGDDTPAYLRTDSASFRLEGVSAATALPPSVSAGTDSGRVVRCRLVVQQLVRPALQHAAV